MRVMRVRIVAALVAVTAIACGEEAGPVANEEGPGLNAGPVAGLGVFRRATPHNVCAGGAFRDFDFWVGEWDVTSGGDPAGTNSVTRELDGCLVQEHWTASDGTRGRSLNSYDPRTGMWHQHWIDEFAQHIRIAGGLNASGQMVMSGDRKALSGVGLTDEITWTPVGSDEVNQFWEITVHAASPFTIVAFDGDYHRTPGVVPAPGSPQDFCSAPEFDQFDFLIGDWAIEGTNGLLIGASAVAEDLSDCLIVEEIATPKGYRSVSFRGYDPREGQWYQTLVDSEGQRFTLIGGLEGDALVLEGDAPGPGASGATERLRVTTEPEGAGARQVWEVQRGATWQTELELSYLP
jgi:hypothetical protein